MGRVQSDLGLDMQASFVILSIVQSGEEHLLHCLPAAGDVPGITCKFMSSWSALWKAGHVQAIDTYYAHPNGP